MRERNLEEIDYLRKRIENLTIPINKSQKNENKSVDNLKIKNKYEEDYDIKIKKREELFNEIYELYDKDIEYKKNLKEKERLKTLKKDKIDSFIYDGKLNKKKGKKLLEYKYNIDTFKEILNKNEHKSKKETKYEDDFSSSDSYDSSLINLNQNIPKNFKLKTKKDIKENENNFKEIMKLLSLTQK